MAHELEENLGRAMRDGPGLRYGYKKWIEARDTKRRKVLIGGVGSWGMGAVWVNDIRKEFDDGSVLDRSLELGYDQAPVKDSTEYDPWIANGPPPGASFRSRSAHLEDGI